MPGIICKDPEGRVGKETKPHFTARAMPSCDLQEPEDAQQCPQPMEHWCGSNCDNARGADSNLNISSPTQEQKVPKLTPVVVSPRAIPTVLCRAPGRSSVRFHCTMSQCQGRDKACSTYTHVHPHQREPEGCWLLPAAIMSSLQPEN